MNKKVEMNSDVCDGGNKELTFTELSPPNRSRTYYFPKGEKITFFCVEKICVRPSGVHRLIMNPAANDGNKLAIVQSGWLAIAIDADKWTL